MNHFRKSSLLILILISILAGCNTQVPHTVSTNPSVAEPSANQQTMKSKQSTTQAKDANWVIEINDTQQITDEEGLIWNYNLSMNASKNGGTDVLGNYEGEIVLNMEPDLDSAKALAKREGADLLSMLFKHHSEAHNITFEVLKYSSETYSELMRKNIPDKPLLQVSNPNSASNALAITRVTFNATQEPINMTVSDGEATASSTIPGAKTSVNIPMEISINGATVTCYLFDTIHPLGRAFEGVITGNVINLNP